MGDAQPQKEKSENYSARNESEAERLDRNYDELLQELRVAENGVQILFAFLLSIAFQQAFKTVTAFQRGVYVVTLVLSAVAAAQLIAPVAIHRMMFRRRRKDELVRLASMLALGGMSSLLLALLGAALLILDYVLNIWAAIGIDAGLAIVFGWFWFILPLRHRGTDPS
jgi:hypothetical protein